VASVDEALAAVAEGADRLELASFDVEGGVTPAEDLMRAVIRRVTVPVMVLVRPRGGGFRYSDPELTVMEGQIAVARRAGAVGVVIGALTADRRVDQVAMLRLLSAARPLAVTFHRAIDVTPDPVAALDPLMALGVERVLTSGGRATALEGAEVIRRMVERAGADLMVMAGGGVRRDNVGELVERTGVREVHARDVRGMAGGSRGDPERAGGRFKGR